jgi:hypothetical protein
VMQCGLGFDQFHSNVTSSYPYRNEVGPWVFICGNDVVRENE